LSGQLAHAGCLDRVVGAGILELGPGYAARLELRLVAPELQRGLLFRRERLRELRLGDVDLGIALSEPQIGELGGGRSQLLLGLPLRGRFLVRLQLEERRLGLDRLAALYEEPVEPAAHRRGDVDVLSLDVTLIPGSPVPRAAAEHRRGDRKHEAGRAHGNSLSAGSCPRQCAGADAGKRRLVTSLRSSQ
jgi:hypothetical protein